MGARFVPEGNPDERLPAFDPIRPHAAWAERCAGPRCDDTEQTDFDAVLGLIRDSEVPAQAEAESLHQQQQEFEALAERERLANLAAERERPEAAEREQHIDEVGRRRATRWLAVASAVALLAALAALLTW